MNILQKRSFTYGSVVYYAQSFMKMNVMFFTFIQVQVRYIIRIIKKTLF